MEIPEGKNRMLHQYARRRQRSRCCGVDFAGRFAERCTRGVRAQCGAKLNH